MPLTHDQQEEIRQQLREQVSALPDEKKAQALKQIADLSPQALEEILKQSEEREQGTTDQESVFRKIITGKIPAQVIADLPEGKAVLDINPISPGHTLLIPRKPIAKATNIPTALFKRTKQIGKTITRKMKAKSIEIATQELFGEAVIHIIPSYTEKKNLLSPRTKMNQGELETIKEKCLIKQRIRKKKQMILPTSQPAPRILLKRRIP